MHRSLVEADNALWGLSTQHPDGWGVAYFIDGTPHVLRSASTAMSDRVFQRVSGVVASETVVAHVRKATQGTNNVLNCHPFQHGRWVFAHNGDIPRFDECRHALLSRVDPQLRRYILGDTDSETIFFLVLTELQRKGQLGTQRGRAEVVEALTRTIGLVREICEQGPGSAPCLLTCILTDGRIMVAVHGGKELYYSTYKSRCGERESCPSLSPECEAETQSGFVNHLLVSSQPLSGENHWHAMAEGDIVGVDGRMRLYRGRSSRRRSLPVLAGH